MDRMISTIIMHW